MSRHGYTDDCEDVLAAGRWEGALRSAIRGARGQAMLRELAAALDAMPVRELYAGVFASPDGEFCALGVLGTARGIDVSHLNPDREDEYLEGPTEPEHVAAVFGISPALAREVMYRNDEIVDEHKWVRVEICGPMRGYNAPRKLGREWPEFHMRSVRATIPDAPARRWRSVRAWVAKQIKDQS
ncbi:MAG: hypothetical protein AB9M53_01125 [Leptothrix sp. (in: b-proteobacteria)]